MRSMAAALALSVFCLFRDDVTASSQTVFAAKLAVLEWQASERD
ncbi:hypothetical protein EV129_10543 [Rhizobium azibense]|uniref:Uncharacterized protein n=1 Tax=Rhizobium azibense TaxID=1136135 RepID=A0A4R3RSI5_9HYPH|nr:hypothetical protein EV129_10543 [Rhizobium azibense]